VVPFYPSIDTIQTDNTLFSSMETVFKIRGSEKVKNMFETMPDKVDWLINK
jgi:hypothetical protein